MIISHDVGVLNESKTKTINPIKTINNDYFNPVLIKENNVLNRWKKYLIKSTDSNLRFYLNYFKGFISSSANARELINFIKGLIHDRSIMYPGGPTPAEYDLRYYDNVILE